MATVKKEVYVSKNPTTVAAYMDDARRWPEWFTGVQSAQPDGVYPQVGGAVKVEYQAVGVTFHITFTQQEYEQGKVAQARMDGMMTGTTRFVLTPEGSGTRVVSVFDYEVPGGGLGKLMDKLLLERMNAENLEKSLAKLKQVLER